MNQLRLTIGILYGILLLPAAWFCWMLTGFAALGGASNILLFTFTLFPVSLLLSSIGNILCARKPFTSLKYKLSLVFIILPVMHFFLIFSFLYF